MVIEWFKAKNLYQRSSDSNILKRDDKCGKDLSWWNCNNFGKTLAHGPTHGMGNAHLGFSGMG